MWRGLRDYILTYKQILASPALRAWFVSVMIRGALLGIVVLLLAVGLGAWWISALGESAWFNLGAVVWGLLLIYFSGAIFGLVMALGLSVFIRERKLVAAISGDVGIRAGKVSLKEHFREVSSSLVSVFVSLLAWPFLISTVLTPVGVLMLAWAYSREAHATSGRIGLEFSAHLRLREAGPSKGYLLGLGLIPSVLSLVPFAAFVVWPTLLVAGLVPANSSRSQISASP